MASESETSGAPERIPDLYVNSAQLAFSNGLQAHPELGPSIVLDDEDLEAQLKTVAASLD